jgi:thioredoxin
MAVQHATDSTFEQLVLANERPVVVDFWASWCGPCRLVAPELEKLASKYEGVVDVVKVDVDANPGLSMAFGIQSIPTIAFFRKGEQPRGVLGFMPLEQLERAFGLSALSEPAARDSAPAGRAVV